MARPSALVDMEIVDENSTMAFLGLESGDERVEEGRGRRLVHLESRQVLGVGIGDGGLSEGVLGGGDEVVDWGSMNGRWN